MRSFKIFIVCMALGLITCKERYTPETTSINNNILVVEGIINTGPDSTFVKLSRSVVLSNKNIVSPELGATLTIETSANETKVLIDKGKGVYAAPPLNFGTNKKYRLIIKTKTGSTYHSEYVNPTTSPQIDSVNYAIKPEGVQIYVNGSDPLNNTHYYRWEFEEDWIFYAKYNASAIWKGGPIAVYREPSESVYKCWGKAVSSTVLIGSSIKLSKDVIYLAPIKAIESTSERLSEKYSILVKQYALSKEEYEFWEGLKKNTESLGSIFDVLPSQLIGNIRNINNANEAVIGYIGAGSIQKKRIYITKDKLPKWLVRYGATCTEPDSIKFSAQRAAFSGGALVPVMEYVDPKTHDVAGHISVNRECADCTIRGTVKQPSFWQ